MFCTDVVVPEPFSLFGGISENAFALEGKRHINRHRQALHGCRSFLEFFANTGPRRRFSLKTCQQIFVFVEQTEQHVLGLDHPAAEIAGLLATKENYPPRSLRVPFKHIGVPLRCILPGLLTRPTLTMTIRFVR